MFPPPVEIVREHTRKAASVRGIDHFTGAVAARIQAESLQGRNSIRLNSCWPQGQGPDSEQLAAIADRLSVAGYEVRSTPQMIGVIPGSSNGVTIIDVSW